MNASDTCAMLFEWHKWSKERLHVEITNKDNMHHFLRYQGYCSLWLHSTRPNSQL